MSNLLYISFSLAEAFRLAFCPPRVLDKTCFAVYYLDANRGVVRKLGLKLKQASAVLQIQPKELQNLVQFGVVKPKRSEGTCFFDANSLLAAKIAFCLKESLGTRTSVLCKLMDVFLASKDQFVSDNPKYIVFNCRLSTDEDPVKVAVPFRALGEQLQGRIAKADLYRDLPRGRKRRGWKKEFLASLADAAKDIGELSQAEILRVVRTHRKDRRMAEITVVSEHQ